MNVSLDRKVKKMHICQNIGLILLKFGVGGVFLDFKFKNQQKIFIRRHSDVKMT